jgi:glycosyltransferase involved in cell wall biosynthesis
VDDGSTDGSGRLLDEFSARDDRIVALHQQNAGVGVARNTGLDCVSGNWVLFLDGDDVLATDLLEKLQRVVIAKDADLYQFKRQEFTDNFLPRCVEDDTIKTIKIEEELPRICYDRGLFEGCYSRKMLDKLHFTDHVRGEDRLFIVKYLQKCTYVVDCCFVGYGYRVRGNSAIHQKASYRILRDEVDFRVRIVEVLIKENRSIGGEMAASFKYNFFNWVLQEQFSLTKYERRKFRKWWLEEMEFISHIGGLRMLRSPYQRALCQESRLCRIAAECVFLYLTYGLWVWRKLLKIRELAACASNIALVA